MTRKCQPIISKTRVKFWQVSNSWVSTLITSASRLVLTERGKQELAAWTDSLVRKSSVRKAAAAVLGDESKYGTIQSWQGKKGGIKVGITVEGAACIARYRQWTLNQVSLWLSDKPLADQGIALHDRVLFLECEIDFLKRALNEKIESLENLVRYRRLKMKEEIVQLFQKWQAAFSQEELLELLSEYHLSFSRWLQLLEGAPFEREEAGMIYGMISMNLRLPEILQELTEDQAKRLWGCPSWNDFVEVAGLPKEPSDADDTLPPFSAHVERRC